jgi:hypothetical protein
MPMTILTERRGADVTVKHAHPVVIVAMSMMMTARRGTIDVERRTSDLMTGIWSQWPQKLGLKLMASVIANIGGEIANVMGHLMRGSALLPLPSREIFTMSASGSLQGANLSETTMILHLWCLRLLDTMTIAALRKTKRSDLLAYSVSLESLKRM